MPSVKMNFSGVAILQGVEFSIFPIDFEWALQQCSSTALPVMLHFCEFCKTDWKIPCADFCKIYNNSAIHL